MTKEELAKQINHKANIVRTIKSDKKLDLVIGEIYDNRGEIESWQDDSCGMTFFPESQGKYEYTFFCNSVPCHKVDYENEEECELLNAYEEEGEVIVHPDTKMKIVDVGTDYDFEEMGYYPVELELLEEE